MIERRGTTQPRVSEGPCFNRCTTRLGGKLMRPRCRLGLRAGEGLDPVVPCNACLPQWPSKIGVGFHALLDKVARSDVDVEGVVRVAPNRGAPGVDGVSVAESGRGCGVGAGFLDYSPNGYGPVPIGRSGCGGPHPQAEQAGSASADQAARHPHVGDRIVMRQPRSCSSRSSRPTSTRSVSGSARNARPIRRGGCPGGRPTSAGGVLDADSRHAATPRLTTRCCPSAAARCGPADDQAAAGMAAGGGVRGRDRLRGGGG